MVGRYNWDKLCVGCGVLYSGMVTLYYIIGKADLLKTFAFIMEFQEDVIL